MVVGSVFGSRLVVEAMKSFAGCLPRISIDRTRDPSRITSFPSLDVPSPGDSPSVRKTAGRHQDGADWISQVMALAMKNCETQAWRLVMHGISDGIYNNSMGLGSTYFHPDVERRWSSYTMAIEAVLGSY